MSEQTPEEQAEALLKAEGFKVEAPKAVEEQEHPQYARGIHSATHPGLGK